MAESAAEWPATRPTLDDGSPTPDGMIKARVLDLRHHTENLFQFSVERDPGFRFQAGEFGTLSLPLAETPFRAYSVASAPWEDVLTFYSINVPGGALTEKLQHVQPGDAVLLRRKTTGTLVCDALTPGGRLLMLSTGTGVAPFASVALDPGSYDAFDELVLVQGCRFSRELQFATSLRDRINTDEMLQSFAAGRFRLVTCTSRDHGAQQGRITDLIYSGKLFNDLGAEPLNPVRDRIMICGSIPMLKEVKAFVLEQGFVEGSRNTPGTFVIERAFVG